MKIESYMIVAYCGALFNSIFVSNWLYFILYSSSGVTDLVFY